MYDRHHPSTPGRGRLALTGLALGGLLLALPAAPAGAEPVRPSPPGSTTQADVRAPAAPSAVQAELVGTAAVDVSWSLDRGERRAAEYVVRLNGSAWATVDGSTRTYRIESLAPGLTYEITVEARDAAGYRSALPPAVQVSTPARRTIVVDPSGAAGTVPTIGEAVAAVGPGDVVRISAGAYDEPVVINASGTPEAPLTVLAEAGAVLHNTVQVNGSHVRLQGLTVDGSLPDGTVRRQTAVKVRAPHNQVVGNRVLDFSGWAFDLSPTGASTGQHSYAADNYIYNTFAGFNTAGSSLVERNEIERVNAHGSTAALGDAFRIFGSDTTFRENHLHGSRREELEPVHTDVFQSWDDVAVPTRNITIENNVFTGWYHQGLMLENDKLGVDGTYMISDWTVRGNVFSGFTAWAVCGGKVDGGIPRLTFENNVFAAHPTLGSHYGVMLVGEGASGVLTNNIITGARQASYGAMNGGVLTSASANLVHDAPAPGQVQRDDVLGLDPQFVDPLSDDFRLRATSPAIDAGSDLGVGYDLAGTRRPQGGGTDIGAYELRSRPEPLAPLVSVLTPLPGAVVGVGGDLTVSVNARDADSKVDAVEYRLDSHLVTRSTEAPFDVVLRDVEEGVHTLDVRVVDRTGRSSSAPPVTFVATDEESSLATQTWSSTEVPPQTQAFTFEADVLTLTDTMDAVIGFSQGPATAYPDVAAVLRFSTEGVVDARDGGVYTADEPLHYEPNTRYRVRMRVDPVTRTYSATVTPPGGDPVTIAQDHAFRTEQSAVTALDHRVLYAVNGSLRVIAPTVSEG